MPSRPALVSLVIASALLLTACSKDEPLTVAPTWLNSTPIGLRDDWKIANNPKQEGVWLTYYQGKSSLFIQPPQGTARMIVDGASNAAPSGLAIAVNSNGMSANMWRDKVPSKGLFIKQGELAPLEIGVEGFDTEPLARFDLKANAEGSAQQGWHVLWFGERFVPEVNAKYNLYYRHIDTQGKASATERLLPGFYPQWIVTENDDVAVFSWDNTQTPPKVVMRVREAQSAQFGSSKIIATTTPSIPPLFRAFRLGSRWFVTWIDQKGETAADFLLRGLWSDDKGSTWTHFDVPSIMGFDITDIRVAHEAANGHAIMAISGTWRHKDPQAMSTFYVLHSKDNGATWSEPKVVRDSAANATSRADAAQVLFGETPGSTWLVWEDWRDVRGRLYFAYSEDYGSTWKHANLPLAGQPEGNNLMAFNREVSYRDPKGLHIVAENVLNDAGIEKKVFSYSLNSKTLEKSLKKEKSVASGENDLKSRVSSYWKALSESNYETSYSFLDPFMRSAWPVISYKQRIGLIKYKPEISIDQVDINGNFADVSIRVRAYVPEFEMGGKKQSAPEREVPINERWVFIDGNWFREYFEDGSEIRFTRYR